MKRIIFFILILIIALIVCLPLFRPGFFVSDDGGLMIIRLSAFYQSFRDGQFPVRFLGRLNFSYGYPVANFNYPGFMYIGSLIHFLGFSFIDTVKILLGGSIITGAVFSFLWLKKYFSDLASFIGSLGYIFAPYLLFDVYKRGSVGEVLAIAAASAGLYSIANKNKWLFGLTVTFLILAHNSLAFVFLGFYILYITIVGLWPEFWKMFCVGIGMGTFFWLPALYERKYVIFDSVNVSLPLEYLHNISNVALFGISGVVAGVASLFFRKHFLREKRLFLATLVLTLFLISPFSSIIWEWKLLAHILQFPFRVLSISLFAGAWLMAYALEYSNKQLKAFLVCLFVTVGIWNTVGVIASVTPVTEPEGFYRTNESTTTIADEYMPKWVIKKPTTHAQDKLVFYKGRGTIKINHMNTQTIDILVEAAEESVIQINTLYYPGWGATVDETKVHIDYSNNEGVMRIPVPAGNHHLVVSFRETISRFLADCLSLVSFVAYIALVIFTGKQIRKKK